MLIMSDCTEETTVRKTRERSSLVRLISRLGVPATMPCTYCFKRKLECKMIEKSSRCQRCAQARKQCDGVLVAGSLEKLLAHHEKLDAEEDKANLDLLQLHEKMTEIQSQLSTAVGRLARIRKIRNHVKGKSLELAERGMLELDKEDKILPALDSHEHYVVDDIQSMGVPNDVDWASFGLGEEFAELGPLVPSGAANIPQESPS
jgi:hypothetical protein